MEFVLSVQFVRVEIHDFHADAEIEEEERKENYPGNAEGKIGQEREAAEHDDQRRNGDRIGKHQFPAALHHQTVRVQERIKKTESRHQLTGQPQIEHRREIDEHEQKEQHRDRIQQIGDGERIHLRDDVQNRGKHDRPDLVQHNVKERDEQRGQEHVFELRRNAAERPFSEFHVLFDESKQRCHEQKNTDHGKQTVYGAEHAVETDKAPCMEKFKELRLRRARKIAAHDFGDAPIVERQRHEHRGDHRKRQQKPQVPENIFPTSEYCTHIIPIITISII